MTRFHKRQNHFMVIVFENRPMSPVSVVLLKKQVRFNHISVQQATSSREGNGLGKLIVYKFGHVATVYKIDSNSGQMWLQHSLGQLGNGTRQH